MEIACDDRGLVPVEQHERRVGVGESSSSRLTQNALTWTR